MEGAPGLVDGSGALWPVEAVGGVSLEAGAVGVFQLRFFRPDGGNVSKYDDSGFVCEVLAVESVTHRQGAWPVEGIAPPGPCDMVEMTSAIAAHADALVTSEWLGTRFLSSSPARRALPVRMRNLALSRARSFFESRGFLHCETPSLVPSGGVESYLDVFSTTYIDHRGGAVSLSLPTSPEFALKKLMCEGHSSVFQIARAFRNGGELSRWHEPEFFMLEWYRQAAPLEAMMVDTQECVIALGEALGCRRSLPSQWPSFRVDALMKSCAGLDLEALQDVEAFRVAARLVCSSVVPSDDWNDIFCKVFMERVEPELARHGACFVTHYPLQMGALARREGGVEGSGKPFVERFEAYLFGVEICNGYCELTDPSELKRRFDAVVASRQAGSKQQVARDVVFEDVMSYGLPPCSGNALGLDRVAALLMGLDSIAPLYCVPFLSQFPKGAVAKD